MLPEYIYIKYVRAPPELTFTDIKSEYIGIGVYRDICKVNGVNAKRIKDEFRNPVWQIEGRMVADWFSDVLESAWQRFADGRVMVIT